MIISHKHKFIFIHIPKCAGSSIKIALRGYYDLDSIEKLGNTDLGGGHWSYNEAKEYFDKNNFNIKNYFKFSFMRNPWARMVSLYEYAHKITAISNAEWCNKIASMSFFEFITKHTGSQLNWVCNKKNNVAVDFLGSGRNIQKEFNIICDKLRIPKQELGHKNATNHKHYTEYYDDETRQIVAKQHAKDIEYFGYKFGE